MAMKAYEFDKRFDEGEGVSKYLDGAKGKSTGVEQFGLKPEASELIREVFRRHPEVREVRVFGSRATGRFEDHSDVDLALWGDLNQALIARIMGELDELPLPYTFDVQAYESIHHEPLKRHINEIGSVLYAAIRHQGRQAT